MVRAGTLFLLLHNFYDSHMQVSNRSQNILKCPMPAVAKAIGSDEKGLHPKRRSGLRPHRAVAGA